MERGSAVQNGMAYEAHKSFGVERALEIWGRRKWLAIAAFTIPCAAAVSLAVFLPDIYRATATVLVERQQLPEALVRPSVTTEIETRLQTINQQILSRARLQDLIERFDLYPEIRRRVPRELVIERVRRDIRLDLKGVEPESGRSATIAFTLSYRGRNPRTAAAVTNAIASFYVDEDQRARERQTAGTAAFLKQQLDEVKQRLDEQDRRVGEFKKLHGGELSEQVEANLAALERLNTELRLNSEAQIRALERRDDLAKKLVEAGVADPASASDAAAARIAKLKTELEDLRTRFSDKYPDVIRLRAEIEALQRRGAEAKEGGTGAADRPTPADPSLVRLQASYDRAQASLKALQDEERTLRKSIDEFQRRVENAPQREQELRELSRDDLTTKDNYESLLKRYQDAQLAESMEQRQQGEQFRILDEAIVPEQPAGPNRLALLIAGLVASVGLAAAAVLVSEQIDTSFHTAGDLRAFTSVPILASIPRIVTDGDLRRRRRRAWATAVPVTLGLALIVAASYVVARTSDALLLLLSIR